MYRRYNPNPRGNKVGDCTVRALSKLLGTGWYETYDLLVEEGRRQCDMPSSNAVWGAVLYKAGYRKRIVPNTDERMTTVREFARQNDSGEYLLATGSHVVAVQDGDYYDSWDSGDEIPVYYWRR